MGKVKKDSTIQNTEVIETIEVKRGKGQPRSFSTEEDFCNKFKEYINYCRKEKRFANIAGFCAYCNITRDTFYAQKDYYSYTYNIIQNILEDEVLQDNTYRAQLYLKNKFGYKDKQEIENTNKNYTMSAEDKELLQKVSKRIDNAENKA